MKTTTKNSQNSTNSISSATKKAVGLTDKILAYCGYKLVGNKLVATGTYNPIPYQGL